MTIKIACLHTHASNIAVFDAAAQALGLPPDALSHTVREDLLAAVEHQGCLTPGLHHEIAQALQALTDQAHAVLLTCSSLGPVADRLSPSDVPIVRADAALAAAAVRGGQRVIVLCAAPTTLAPTRHVFAQAALATGSAIEVRLVQGAWALFKAGDRAGYLASLRTAVAAAQQEDNAVVALAQASMAPVITTLGGAQRPLTSPGASLQAILERLASAH